MNERRISIDVLYLMYLRGLLAFLYANELFNTSLVLLAMVL